MHSERMRALGCEELGITSDNFRSDVDLSGEWRDLGNSYTLKQDGSSVTGTYRVLDEGSNRTGAITNGSFEIRTCVLKFEYTIPWRNGEGRGEFKLSADGRTLGGYSWLKLPEYTVVQEGGWTLTRRLNDPNTYVGCTPK